MRYFTRGWTRGELTDEEAKATLQAYRARLARIEPRLPPAFVRLDRDVSLHDGIIEQIVWNSASRRLEMSLVCGDQQSGYFLAQLTYLGAVLGGPRVDSLKRAAEGCQELVHDELDVDDGGLLSHRLLFEPSEEVTIDFEDFEMRISPRGDRSLRLDGFFIEEVPGGGELRDAGAPHPPGRGTEN